MISEATADSVNTLGAGSTVPSGDGTLDGLSPEQKKVMEQRYTWIEPLLALKNRSRMDVQKRAAEVGLSTSSLYRYLRAYESTRLASSLKPAKRKWRPRTTNKQEKILDEVIHGFYMRLQKPSCSAAYREVRRRCYEEGLRPVSRNTLRNRILNTPQQERVRARHGVHAARKLELIGGSFDAQFPYDIVEVDHTKLDVLVVREDTRQMINKRPWITLAMDVFSRMVAGFYISLERPGMGAVGMCLAQAILPKTQWLQEHGVEAEWPCRGLIRCIHVDNAREFRCQGLELACFEYGINIQYRKVKTPSNGGHVERLLGTLSEKVKVLPGATFSNPSERADYDSPGEACLSLRQLERWIAIELIDKYHRELHSSLLTTPLQKWHEGQQGSKDHPAPGIILPDDPARLRIDFMPALTCTVQRYGVQIGYVRYNSAVLRRWVGATEPGSKERRLFTIRYDPRNMGRIYFHDPHADRYEEIPYADKRHPPLSRWELKAGRDWLREQGLKTVSEATLMQAAQRQRQLEETAREKTAAARKVKVSKRDKGPATASMGTAKPKAVQKMVPLPADLDEVGPDYFFPVRLI